jgi:uncharacterized protein (TIRG00374 family)
VLPRSVTSLLGRHRQSAPVTKGEMPAALGGARLRKGLLRLALFVAVVAVLIVAVPGLASIRTRLSHGSPGWLGLAAGLRLASALSYVFLFRAVFAPNMSFRSSYRIAMSEIGVNALAPIGGAGGLAVGGWVLHREGLSWQQVVRRSAEFFVFTSVFNVGAVAVLGWLGAAGVIASHVSFWISAVPALAATIFIVAALALVPRVPALEARQGAQRPRSLRWWLLELLVALGSGAEGAIRVFRQRDLIAIASGAGYLLFDVATLWAAVRAFHGHTAIEPLAMGYLVGQLAGEIPIPGGLGVVEGGLIGALILYGVPATLATASTLAYRAIALGVPVLFGGAAALSLVRTLRHEDESGAGSGAVAGRSGL